MIFIKIIGYGDTIRTYVCYVHIATTTVLIWMRFQFKQPANIEHSKWTSSNTQPNLFDELWSGKKFGNATKALVAKIGAKFDSALPTNIPNTNS